MTKYMRKTQFLCELVQCGKTLISLSQQFSDSIEKNLGLEQKQVTKL